MSRTCKTCDDEWDVDPLEAEHFRGRGTGVPRVCTSCRALARSFADRTLSCTKCDSEFAWPKELGLYTSIFDWKEPHRCPGGCADDLEEVKRFRGDMYVIGPVWLRMVRGIDLDAAPTEELTPEQQLRATKVPRLDDLFKGLGSGMSPPRFGDAPSGTPSSGPVSAVRGDDLPPEILPTPDSLFGGLKD